MSGIAVSNGLAFSPVGEIRYFADTPVGIIRRSNVGVGCTAFDEVDPLAGADVAPGAPHGAIVDAQCFYWNARVWGGCLVRIGPDGRLVERVDLPTKGPTCVALGGPGLNELFATTLRLRHTEKELHAAPYAGGLFTTSVSVPGDLPRLAVL